MRPAQPQPHLWITGARGLIGNQLHCQAPTNLPTWRVTGLTRETLDLLDSRAVRQRFEQDRPDLIVHCAGLTLSSACSSAPALAWKLNVDVTTHLADLAASIPLVFFSTDLVFDGLQGNYIETDPVRPLSVYGRTKAEAEKRVLQNPRHWVVRTSLNFGVSPRGNRSFNEEMTAAWQHGKTLTLFVDEFRCPIPAATTARAILHLAATGAFDTRAATEARILHLAGAERLSRWEIGQILLAQHPQFNQQVRPGRLQNYKGEPRSPDTSLCCDKIQRILPFSLPKFSEVCAARRFPIEPFDTQAAAID